MKDMLLDLSKITALAVAALLAVAVIVLAALYVVSFASWTVC